MAKRRHNKTEELMLIPFLDILCSLIGVLVLIIVVLCVAQTQRAKGRTQEDIERSIKYVDAQKKQKNLDLNKHVLVEQQKKLEELQKTAKEKDQRRATLRRLISNSAQIQKETEVISQNLIKELDDLMVEIEGLTKQEKLSKDEIASLNAEIKKRQIPPDKKVPPVVVQPGGSGLAQGSKLFFIESTGNKLTLFWDAEQRTILSATDEVIVADPNLQYFLAEVKKVPNSKIIFLLRDDGMGAYNKALGWAQATFKYPEGQIGKLPIPGRGIVDLKMFKTFLGTLAPAPGANIAPPPVAPKQV